MQQCKYAQQNDIWATRLLEGWAKPIGETRTTETYDVIPIIEISTEARWTKLKLKD